MNNLKLFKFSFCFFIVTSLLSCSDENTDLYEANDLIGTWERSDSTETFGYALFFDTEDIGFRTSFTKNIEQEEFTSSIMSFQWTTADDVLTIEGLTDIKTTRFSIDSDGHLHLYEFSDATDPSSFYFIKVE